MSDPAALLTIDALTCERGDRLLFEGLSFSVAAGEVVQIEGANGSGKTTLLRCLVGLFTDHAGAVVRSPDTDCLYLGHKPAVRSALTVAENLSWLLQLSETACSPEEIAGALAETGLAGYEDTFAGELSAGQTKRIALARIFLPTPTVWLLDEPFAAIDQAGVARLSDRIDRHVAAGGAVVLTTHQDAPLTADVRRVTL